MKRYRHAHPQFDMRIDVNATADPVAHLIDGRLDVAIVSDPVRDRRVVARPLFRSRAWGTDGPGVPRR